MKPPQFLLFLAAGGTAAAVNFVSRILLDRVLDYVPSILIAYLIGMATAFTLNRLFVFTGAVNSMQQQAWRFALVNLAAVAQTMLVSLLFARLVFPAFGMDFHPETIAHAIGIVTPVYTSYLGHKYFSFPLTERDPPP